MIIHCDGSITIVVSLLPDNTEVQLVLSHIPLKRLSKVNRIYDGVEAETKKSQGSFQII